MKETLEQPKLEYTCEFIGRNKLKEDVCFITNERCCYRNGYGKEECFTWFLNRVRRRIK